MSNATTAGLMWEACSTTARVIKGAAGADLATATPCDGFSLRTLLTHFTGTTGAFAYAGKTRSLDANDPWGSTVQLNEDEWPEQLTANLDAISAAWCQQDTWQGTISGTVMPARSLGEMALIEVLLHGWDVARATDQQVDVSDALGAELLRCVAETADLGRQVGAYGTKVPVADNASDFAKALGLAGRSPN
ncbi:MAG TPA: TIGR03086 family metal-binding protein [Propionibacteriaceae bacterium]